MTEADQIQAIRRFNRCYTQTIGTLNEHYLKSPHSLTELRILYELSQAPGITAKALATCLALDHGFLSRKLAGLEHKQCITRQQSTEDKRQQHLYLTAQAEAAQPVLERAADAKVEQLLANIPPERHALLVAAMQTVERILSNTPPPPVIFRQLQGGDAGWIIHRHGGIIAREFSWNLEFEALAAQIMADFIRNYRPNDERSWIVERGGEILGSLFLIRENETTARLRLLYIEKAARGLGLATKLLEKSFQFARDKGYKTVVLFTTDGNLSARRIYTKLGMRLTKREPFAFAGQQQTGETWEMVL